MTFKFPSSPMASWPGCLSGLGTDSGQATRKAHIALFGAAKLQLVYAGWYDSGTDRTISGPIRVKASIEYPAGHYLPVRFDGADADGYVTIPVQTNAVSLPCDVSIPAGARFFSNTSVIPASGGSYPVGRDHGATAFPPTDSCTPDCTGDYTLRPQPRPAATPKYCYIPIAICGAPLLPAPRTPVVGIIGDSIAQGVGSAVVPETAEEVGIFQEACQRAGIGYVNFAINNYRGNYLRRYLVENDILRQTLASCTDICISIGTNDLYDLKLGKSSAPRLITIWQEIWHALTPCHAKIWQATMPPRTRSTDGYRTEAGQSPWNSNFGPEVAGGSQWTIANAYLRTRPAPLAGIIDLATHAAVLSPQGTYVWRPGFSTDGTHPVPTAGRPDFVALVPVGAFG